MPPSFVWDTTAAVAERLSPDWLKSQDFLTKWQYGGVSPFSTKTQVASAMLTYLCLIFGGQIIMSDHKPKHLKPLFMLHNVLLSSGSLLLLALMVEELLPIIYQHGMFFWNLRFRELDSATWDTIHLQLPFQILGISRHSVFSSQEEAPAIPPRFPSHCYCHTLLYSTQRKNERLMGTYHSKFDGSRLNVLLLLHNHSFPWQEDLVETLLDYPADLSVCHRSFCGLLC